MSLSRAACIVLRTCTLGVAAALTVAPLGCSKQPAQRELFPVKGQLFMGKKAAAGAIIWLHRVELLNAGADPALLAEEPRPRGVVRDDGSFDISTYGTGDGAPIGRYRLAVYWTKPAAHGDDSGVSLLPARYQDPKNSGLPVVEVKSEPNVLPTLYVTPQ